MPDFGGDPEPVLVEALPAIKKALARPVPKVPTLVAHARRFPFSLQLSLDEKSQWKCGGIARRECRADS
jgi:hypothetical protein